MAYTVEAFFKCWNWNIRIRRIQAYMIATSRHGIQNMASLSKRLSSAKIQTAARMRRDLW